MTPPPQQVEVPEGAGMSKVRVNVKHDIHGMFNVQSAEMMQEIVKAPVSSFICLCLIFWVNASGW